MRVTKYNGPPDKGGIHQKADCLIRQKGIRLTERHKSLAFDIQHLSAHSNLISWYQLRDDS